WGLPALSAAEGLRLFDLSLRTDAAMTVPLRVDLAVLRGRGDQVPALLRGLVPAARWAVRAVAGGGGRRPPRRKGAVAEVVRHQIAAVLGHADGADIRGDRAFKDLGFTSLTTVELRNVLAKRIGLALPATMVFDHPTADELITYLWSRIEGAAPEVSRPQVRA